MKQSIGGNGLGSRERTPRGAARTACLASAELGFQLGFSVGLATITELYQMVNMKIRPPPRPPYITATVDDFSGLDVTPIQEPIQSDCRPVFGWNVPSAQGATRSLAELRAWKDF